MRFFEDATRTDNWQQRLKSYREYLDSMKTRLPSGVYDFALADWHYNPNHQQSLHDSWVESVSIVESPIGGDKYRRRVDISIRLLGAYHDGHIQIDYVDVNSYSIDLPDGNKPDIRSNWHGDWLVDEIALSERGLVVHEIEFANGSRWIIESKDLKFEWKPFQ